MTPKAIAITVIGVLALAGVSMSYDGIEEALAHMLDPLTLTHTGSITNGTNTVLDSPRGIEVFSLGGVPFAFVASHDGDGIQVITMFSPALPLGVGNIVDGSGRELDGAFDLALWVHDNGLYAAVTGHADNGFQVINLTNPASPEATAAKADSGGRYLSSPRGVDVFQQGDQWFAAVAAFNDNGVQIFNVTDPDSIQTEGRIRDNGNMLLGGAYDIKVYESDSKTYAVVTSFNEDGVQILNITDVNNITPVSNIRDNSTLTLQGADGIDIIGGNGNPFHALIAARVDHGVQILDITDPADIGILGQIDSTDGTGANTNRLSGASDIRAFSWQGSTYAAVTSTGRDGVQILDITDRHLGDPQKVLAGSIVDGAATTLQGAADVAFFTTGGKAYLAVTASVEHGVEIIQLQSNTGTNKSPRVYAGANQTVNAGDVVTLGSDSRVTDADGDPVTYAWAPQPFPVGHPLNAITLSNKHTQTTTFTAPYTDDTVTVLFTLVVHDHHDSSGEDDVWVTILGNRPPIVDAGPDRSVPDESLVILDGTASDPDGHTPLTYLWEDASDPTNPQPITINNNAALDTHFTAPDVTANVTYTLRLTATDSRGFSADDFVNITIYDAPSRPPVVDAGDTQTADEGDRVILTGTARDPEGEAMTYDWTCRSPSDSFRAGTTRSVTFTAPEVSGDTTYTCTFTATDPHGVPGTDSMRLSVRNLPDDGPRMSMIGDARPTVVVGSSYVDPGATCTSARFGTSLSYTTSGSVDTSTVGTYEIKYKCIHADSSITHTRIIKVIHSSSDSDPKVTINYQRGAVKDNAPNADYSGDAVCRDKEDGDISHKITTTTAYRQVDDGNGGYKTRATITYSCTDSGGNTVTATIGATVITGNSPPTISVIGGSIHLNVGDSWSDPGATCHDAEDGTWTIKAFKNTIDTTTPGHYLMLYSCVDSHGTEHVNGGVRHVYVTNSNLPPVLTLSSYQQTISVNGTWSMPTATCMDKEDGDISSLVSIYGDNSVNVHKAGTYRMSFNCEDTTGNHSDTKYFEVIVTE